MIVIVLDTIVGVGMAIGLYGEFKSIPIVSTAFCFYLILSRISLLLRKK